jgi:bacillithiol biosynthesis cysteine-adding enzyme BshC
MKIDRLSFEEIPQLSAFDKAFQAEDEQLRAFITALPRLDVFQNIISKKSKSYMHRSLLHACLLKQYSDLSCTKKTSQNLQLLANENCFTVTTAHQPALFCGPLYFIYKIAGTIHLANKLKLKYPEYDFVPLYWMGSEDHDFEELNHLNLFGKKLQWEDYQGGAFGHYHNNTLGPLIESLKSMLGSSSNADELREMIERSFQNGLNYQESMFRFIHELFDRFGLIILLPDAPELKKASADLFKDDLIQNSSQKLISETAEKLKSAGFSNQAYARPINLFYLMPGKRERIEKTELGFMVLNSDLRFTPAEMLEELELHPERFSPNVILRPLYQELLLPNLAYIGGGGELAYWVERKAQFEFYKVPFPILIRRNSVQWIDQNSVERMEKLGLSIVDIFKDTEQLIIEYIGRNSNEILHFDEEKSAIGDIFAKMSEKIKHVDASLLGHLAAQGAALHNALEKLESKLLRSEKQKQETALNQIKKLQEKLGLPDGLQERKENFMSLYLSFGKDFFDFLVAQLNPLEKDFLIISANAEGIQDSKTTIH